MASIRQLHRSELDILLDWAAEEQWNPGDEGDVFWATDPDAYIGIEDDGELAGALAIVDYSNRLGNMGLFILQPHFRGKGLGRQLWYHGRDRLLERLAPGSPIAIDGVEAMQPFYSGSGFVKTHDHHRMHLTSAVEQVPSEIVAISRPAGALPELDTRCFGAPRPTFLGPWLAHPGHIAVAYLDDRLRGYGVLRPCRIGYKVGPLFADSVEVADAVLGGLTAQVSAASDIFIDVPSVNTAGMQWAAQRGGEVTFTCARMYYGTPPSVEWSNVFGVTSLELG